MEHAHLGLTFKTGVIILVASFGVEMTTVAAGPSLPAYLTERNGKTNPQSISSDEALWAAFRSVSLREATSPGLGAKFLQGVGLSAADALALANHIEASIADAKAYSRQLSESFCAQRATIQSSSASYVQALQEMDSKSAQRQAALISKLGEIVSPAGKATFYEWTTTQILPNLTLLSADHAMRVAILNVDPAVEIERFCSGINAPAAPTRVQSESTAAGTLTLITR